MKIQRGELQDETVLVIGSGPSVNDFNVDDLHRFNTIGVNQISRRLDCDIVTLLDTPAHMGEGMPYTMRSLHKSHTVMSEHNWPQWEKWVGKWWEGELDATIINFSVPPTEWKDWDGPAYASAVAQWDESEDLLTVPYGMTSCGVACWIAAFMGASRIGLIGVDLGPNYFFESWKPHATPVHAVADANRHWGNTADYLLELTGTELYNLSEQSQVDSVPGANLAAWLKEMAG